MAHLTRARFTGEWVHDGSLFEGFRDESYSGGIDMGGWETPLFTYEQALAYTRWQNAQPASSELGRGWYDDERDAFIFEYTPGCDPEDRYCFEAQPVGELKLYHFTDWIWEETR